MNISLTLLALHFLSDFILQSNWMALNKSKDWFALFLHCVVYSSVFIWYGWLFVLLAFLTHFVQDAITSRITSKLWFIQFLSRPTLDVLGTYPLFARVESNKRHWFFVMIGLDQLVHFATLAWIAGVV